MGSIRGKLLFGLECLVQTLEHMIKLVCKLMEFIFAAVQFDTLLQVISRMISNGIRISDSLVMDESSP